MQLAEIFRKASSRLLIIGLPGSGKTIVLLHLALEFLKTEKNFYPIILNLATWNKKFNTLNDWLSEILIAELSNNNKLSLKLLKDKKFIFLFDGFDEIEENSRQEFLVAMQQFWADAKQKYVITSRIEEYAQFADNILTYRPIKVESLNFEQIETELKKQAFKQPEAKILLNALKADSLLQKVAEVPFYFNTLQLLFASGKKLSEFNFRSQNVTARQNEIVERFVENELKQIDALQYEPKKVLHWLSFLAFKMTDFDLVVFELADLQYYWWKWSLDESFGINFLYNYLENISLIFFLFLVSIFTFSFSISTVIKVITCFHLVLSFVWTFINRKINIHVRDLVKFRAVVFIRSILARLVIYLFLFIGIGVLCILINALYILFIIGFSRNLFINSNYNLMLLLFKIIPNVTVYCALIYGIYFGFLENIEESERLIIQIKNPY